MLWWLSNCFVLVGAALYSHVRGQEMKARHKQQQQQQSLEEPTKTGTSAINDDPESKESSAFLSSK